MFERALDVLGPRIGVLYGLTEAPVTCYMPPRTLATDAERRSRLMQSVGRVLPGYEVRLDGADADADQSGEVLIRGGNVMAGYWQDEAATGAALRDGWLHTGDIGQFDEDGFLSIVGPAEGGDPLRRQHHRAEGGRGRDPAASGGRAKSRCSACPTPNGAKP